MSVSNYQTIISIIITILYRLLIKNGCVSHDPKLGTFTVLGSNGKPHVVHIFPSEDCSCPSTTSCYHMIAVKLSLGIPVAKEQKR